MRIPIRIQLGGLLLLSSLIGLAVISIAVWVTVHGFVLDIRASRLALTASLKAGQLSSNLDVMQTSASFVTTRVLIQQALMRYNDNRDNTPANWVSSAADMAAAIGGEASLGQQLLMQSRVWPKDAKGPAGVSSLLNTTGDSLTKTIPLPYTYPNGSTVFLGAMDSDYGYPPILYPNLTFSSTGQPARYGDYTLYLNSTLFLGPWSVNSTYSLVSLTMPIVNNTNRSQLLGYTTIMMNGKLISQVVNSVEGLGNSGETLLVGPADSTNRLPTDISFVSKEEPDLNVRHVVPLNNTESKRHPQQTRNGTNPTFTSNDFPAVNKAFAATDSSGSQIRATNEAGKEVSVGYAMSTNTMVDWAVLVEMSRDEVWQPIDTLRKVILACLFATAGLLALVAFPLAHFAAMPIILLREATLRSVDPPSTDGQSDMDSFAYMRDGPNDNHAGAESRREAALARKEGFSNPLSKWKRKRDADAAARREERRKRAFRIPGRVKQRRGCIKDELSDLTYTFNEMSDELMMQYSKLDERVKQRTAELELSKKAAEAANESKTLFIANISHELKTPLNGILGMCAVCMQEDDPLRLKRSLGIIYKSGDLLLNLLTDLLTFSKNQVGQNLSLDEKEFRLRDVSSQTLAIFDQQAKDGHIDLKVQYEGVADIGVDNALPERLSTYGPDSSGRLSDMILFGDIHRILQVVINLTSNSLKFTPPGGSVVITIRALSERPDFCSRAASVTSKQSNSMRLGRSSRQQNSDSSVPRLSTQRYSDTSVSKSGTLNPDATVAQLSTRNSSEKTVPTLATLGLPRASERSVPRLATANAINARDKPHASIQVSERTHSPMQGNYIYFEFEVSDTGPGIPEEIQDKIFEPFMQGDLGLSKKFGGTGLGLSICSQLAGLMKGSMRVRSTVGLGSTFTLKIPIRHVQTRADSSASSLVGAGNDLSRTNSWNGSRTSSPQRPHAPADHKGSSSPSPPEAVKSKAKDIGEVKPSPQSRLVGLSQPYLTTSKPAESPGSQDEAMKRIAATANGSAKIRVLVAEDNKINQEVVLRMLKLEDIYDVVVARDGQEALDLVKTSMRSGSRPFNLIFMDVQMPNVDGLTSTKMIRAIGYQAPIVALTAFAEESNIKDCYDSGMNYFLSKPIRRPQLKKVLKEYIAPIVEEPEEEELPTPALIGPGNHNTTIVMVDRSSRPQSLTWPTPMTDQLHPEPSRIRSETCPVSSDRQVLLHESGANTDPDHADPQQQQPQSPGGGYFSKETGPMQKGKKARFSDDM